MDKTINYIHFCHLAWRKQKRFMDFCQERIKNGVPIKEIIETWNRFQKHPEDTVYMTYKN